MSAVSESPGADRTLEDLLERVKGLTYPDRDVDHHVLRALGLMKGTNDPITGREMVNDLGGRIYSHPAPITASLDAVVALCERLLPGWQWSAYSGSVEDEDRPSGNVWPRSQPFPAELDITEEGATPALALLAALLDTLVKSRSPSLVG